MKLKMVRPDSKGRITLGSLAKGISGFAVTQTDDHKIILEPYTEIPARAKWLFDNKAALKSLGEGLTDSAERRLNDLGSFAEFAKDDE